jgi:hypothetical protein
LNLELIKIEGLGDGDQKPWRIRALRINGKSPALESLLSWKRSEQEDFKRIISILKQLARMELKIRIRSGSVKVTPEYMKLRHTEKMRG